LIVAKHLIDELILIEDENVLMVNYLLLIEQLIEIEDEMDMFHNLVNENIQHQKMILLLH
jgi:hypothetical protein